jgi:hypothetical protein
MQHITLLKSIIHGKTYIFIKLFIINFIPNLFHFCFQKEDSKVVIVKK